MQAYERFLKYVRFGTQSREGSGCTPSTDGQLILAQALRDELGALQLEAECDQTSYVYATIPATPGFEKVPSIGFIAHMDTSDACSGDNVEPILHHNYDGNDIRLNDELTLRVSDFPELKELRGQTLITANGSTLLGADDKAGVAEIMTLAERLIQNDIPHGRICIAFTPDEEIGEGADHFDVKRFGADYAYTVDGGAEGGIEYENFNASAAEITFRGISVHPGSAKNIMINASLVAMEFNSLLPATDIPGTTEEREGFFHLTDMSGDVSSAKLSYIIRDHDAALHAFREELLRRAVGIINHKYGEGTATLVIREQYRNMLEMIKPHMHIIDIAVRASRSAGVEPFFEAIRGGTDGARLSFMGLPCPNLGTGGYAFHGPYEHITVESMDKVVDILENIVKEFASER